MDTLMYVKIKGPAGRIQIDDGGEGTLPVIFAHSFGGSTEQWSSQLDYLRRSTRAIAYDLRGHGGSDTPQNDDYTVDSQEQDLAAVVEALKLERFILVGHSMGGAIAIDYAGKHPERVAGLMMVGTPGKSPEELSKPMIASLESGKYAEVMDNYMKQLLTNARPKVNEEVMKGMNKIPRQEAIAVIRSVFNFDPAPSLRNYPGPKLIVSTTMEKQPHALHNQFPGISHKTIDGTSHWMQMDKPREFNQILDEFLSAIK